MSELYEYKDTTHFTAGAVGEPGARTFFIQAGDGFGVHSVKLEKQQVAALADFLRTILEDLPAPTNTVLTRSLSSSRYNQFSWLVRSRSGLTRWRIRWSSS